MLTEKIKKATLRIESESGISQSQTLRGIIFRAGASDFEFSAQQGWEGRCASFVAYRGKTPVGTVNVRHRNDGTLRLILTTPPVGQKLSSDQFRQLEQAVAGAMDYVYNRLMDR